MFESGEISSMREMATAHHEIYNSYVEVGFSEEQAFELTKIILQMHMMMGTMQGGDSDG